MGIDVIRSVLRIILQNEHSSARPELCLRQRLDHSAEREVIVREISERCWPSAACSTCMIVRQTHDPQLRHASFALELSQLFDPYVRANLIFHLQAVSRKLPVCMIYEIRLVRFVRRRFCSLLVEVERIDELAVIAIRYPSFVREIP